MCNVTAPPSSSAAIWLLPGAWSRASRHHMLHVAESRPDEGGRGDVCAGPAPSYERGTRATVRLRVVTGQWTSLDVELNSKTHKPTCVLATENLLLKSRTSNVN